MAIAKIPIFLPIFLISCAIRASQSVTVVKIKPGGFEYGGFSKDHSSSYGGISKRHHTDEHSYFEEDEKITKRHHIPDHSNPDEDEEHGIDIEGIIRENDDDLFWSSEDDGDIEDGESLLEHEEKELKRAKRFVGFIEDISRAKDASGTVDWSLILNGMREDLFDNRRRRREVEEESEVEDGTTDADDNETEVEISDARLRKALNRRTKYAKVIENMKQRTRNSLSHHEFKKMMGAVAQYDKANVAVNRERSAYLRRKAESADEFYSRIDEIIARPNYGGAEGRARNNVFSRPSFGGPESFARPAGGTLFAGPPGSRPVSFINDNRRPLQGISEAAARPSLNPVNHLGGGSLNPARIMGNFRNSNPLFSGASANPFSLLRMFFRRRK